MATRMHPGETIDGFTIEGLLHAGGNGYIYRVRPEPGRGPGFPLVMKVPGVGHGEPTLGVVSFEIEQVILPQLTGSHVPRIVAVGDDPLRPFLVMEEIAGESLANVVKRAPLLPPEVATIGAALADAIHDIHRQHVLHLDLKPENCILSSQGEAVLLDFGFARHAHYPDLLAGEEFFAAGSAAYVSPEQLQGKRSDPRSDVFALGVLLYELATGQPPFGEPATYGGMRDRLWRLPLPPRLLRPTLPPWLQEVILHCLEARAERRMPSAAHVAFDLRHPDEVALTRRSTWTARAGFLRQARSWWRSRQAPFAAERRHAVTGTAPVLLIAVDTEHPDDERHSALQRTTAAIVAMYAEYRLLFVSAIRAAPLGEGDRLEDTASGKHLEHRNRLRAWTTPLKLPPAGCRSTSSRRRTLQPRFSRSRTPIMRISSSSAPRRPASARSRGGARRPPK